MPRMRPAMRSGWKSSSASSFSPTPTNLIGLPVTARIDSAAPPRPSPSTRVRTMPVSVDARVEALGEIDGVLAGQRVDHQQRLVRLRRSARSPPSRPSALRRYGAAGGVEQQHVVAAELGRLHARAWRSAPGPRRRRSAACRRRSARRARASCSCAAGRRVSSEAISTLLLLALLQPLGELGGGGGLARALQADHHHHHRRRGGEVDAA